jgi:hypothetical protein
MGHTGTLLFQTLNPSSSTHRYTLYFIEYWLHHVEYTSNLILFIINKLAEYKGDVPTSFVWWLLIPGATSLVFIGTHMDMVCLCVHKCEYLYAYISVLLFHKKGGRTWWVSDHWSFYSQYHNTYILESPPFLNQTGEVQTLRFFFEKSHLYKQNFWKSDLR